MTSPQQAKKENKYTDLINILTRLADEFGLDPVKIKERLIPELTADLEKLPERLIKYAEGSLRREQRMLMKTRTQQTGYAKRSAELLLEEFFNTYSSLKEAQADPMERMTSRK